MAWLNSAMLVLTSAGEPVLIERVLQDQHGEAPASIRPRVSSASCCMRLHMCSSTSLSHGTNVSRRLPVFLSASRFQQAMEQSQSAGAHVHRPGPYSTGPLAAHVLCIKRSASLRLCQASSFVPCLPCSTLHVSGLKGSTTWRRVWLRVHAGGGGQQDAPPAVPLRHALEQPRRHPRTHRVRPAEPNLPTSRLQEPTHVFIRSKLAMSCLVQASGSL